MSIQTSAGFPYNDVKLPIMADPGSGQPIPVDQSAIYELDLLTAIETNTVADPTFLGQVLFIYPKSYVINGSNKRSLLFTTAIDNNGSKVADVQDQGSIFLKGLNISGALRWRVFESWDTTQSASLLGVKQLFSSSATMTCDAAVS